MFPEICKEKRLRPILHLCLASLVHHSDALIDTLESSSHALLSTYIFRNQSVMMQLKERVVTRNSKWMKPTGIPPHIELYRQQQETLDAVEALPDILVERMGKLIEEKGVGAGNITKELMQEMILNLMSQIGLQSSSTNVDSKTTQHRTEVHFWSGKYHLLPESFEFPSIDLKGAWMLWWFGNKRLGYPPFKNICTTDLSTRKKRQTYSEWSIIMRRMESEVEQQLSSIRPRDMTEEKAADLFFLAVVKLPKPNSSHNRRSSQIKITTALKLIRQHEHSLNPNRRRRPYQKRKRARKST